jgi:hypothetical protein
MPITLVFEGFFGRTDSPPFPFAAWSCGKIGEIKVEGDELTHDSK